MRYLSLFSGIEAATSAWHPLGWECVGVAEIEPFPSKVLRYHYPNVRNLGDVTKLTEMDIADLGLIDIVVFGSPCQDLSVAGKRKGLAGARSGLFFTAMQIITWSRLWCGTRFALWENVPGAFSSNKGADFAAVVDDLSGLAGTEPPPKGWGNEGCAAGPEAMVEWSTLDAQWFGVAQRRRRVFALADFGDWAGRQPILLEPQGMRGDTAPSRKTGQVAPTIPARSLGGGGLGTDFDCDGGVVQVCPTLRAGGNKTGGDRPPGTDVDTVESLVPVTTHTLRGEGFDVSEDGTGRGTPLIPVGVDGYNGALTGAVAATMGTRGSSETASGPSVMVPVAYAIQAGALRTNPASGPDGVGVQADHAYTLEARAEVQAVCFDTTQITSKTNRSNPQPGDPCHPLAAGAHAPAISFPGRMSATQCASPEELSPSLCSVNPTAVAFSSKDYGADATCDMAPTLRAMGHSESHANGGGQMAVAYTTKLRNTAMQVRRLTPEECEKLQGFLPGHTQIPWRKKPADQCPDGPRYKALGNSMAVPVMRWIGRRIDTALLFQE